MPKELHITAEIEIFHSLHSSLTSQLRRALTTLGTVAESCNSQVYLVGGTLRDAVLGAGLKSATPDIVVVGNLVEFVQACLDRTPASSLVFTSRHNTACVEIEGQPVELAAARKDTYSPAGSLPEISLVTSIEHDLPRRDFTVNAMAVRLLPEGFGEFHDPFNGLRDCSRALLRSIAKDSFLEDPMRMLRGVRIAARCGLAIESGTADQIREAQPALRRFSRESANRLFNEFEKWFAPRENLSGILLKAHQLGILSSIGLANPKLHKALHLRLSDDLSDAAYGFATALQCFESRVLIDFNSRMPLPRAWRKVLEQTVEFRATSRSIDWIQLPTSEAARIVRTFDERVVLLASGELCDIAIRHKLHELNRIARSIKPVLDGIAIERIGVPRGSMIGEILDSIVNQRLDGNISSIDEEIDYVKSRAPSES